MALEPQPQSSTFSPTLLQRGETLPAQHHGLHPGPPPSGSSSSTFARGGRASPPAGGPPEDTPRPIGSGTEQQRCAPHSASPRAEPIFNGHRAQPEPIINGHRAQSEPIINGHHRTQPNHAAHGHPRAQHPPPGERHEPLPTKKYRANLVVASLNMRGRSSQSTGSGPIPKWTTVMNMLRTEQIGVLALQETHLDEDTTSQIRTVFDRRMMILNLHASTNQTASAGVAFVLNKEKINIKKATLKELIPGRATFLSLEWQQEEPLHLLNIYAPNDLRAHPEFWNELEEKWRRLNLPSPTFMLGDFNLTEDPLDRAPTRSDLEPAVSALRDCRQALNVQDTWRQTHPTDRCFSYASANNTLSRIDRIYTRPDMSHLLYDWSIEASQVPTDHKLLIVKYAPADAPFIGKGRWSWPLGLLHDATLTKRITALGQSLQDEISSLSRDNRLTNPQTIWEQFKDDIRKEAKSAARSQMVKIKRKITNLKKDLTSTLRSDTLDTEEDTRWNVIALEREITHLEKKRYKSAHPG